MWKMVCTATTLKAYVVYKIILKMTHHHFNKISCHEQATKIKENNDSQKKEDKRK